MKPGSLGAARRAARARRRPWPPGRASPGAGSRPSRSRRRRCPFGGAVRISASRRLAKRGDPGVEPVRGGVEGAAEVALERRRGARERLAAPAGIRRAPASLASASRQQSPPATGCARSHDQVGVGGGPAHEVDQLGVAQQRRVVRVERPRGGLGVLAQQRVAQQRLQQRHRRRSERSASASGSVTASSSAMYDGVPTSGTVTVARRSVVGGVREGGRQADRAGSAPVSCTSRCQKPTGSRSSPRKARRCCRKCWPISRAHDTTTRAPRLQHVHEIGAGARRPADPARRSRRGRNTRRAAGAAHRAVGRCRIGRRPAVERCDRQHAVGLAADAQRRQGTARPQVLAARACEPSPVPAA